MRPLKKKFFEPKVSLLENSPFHFMIFMEPTASVIKIIKTLQKAKRLRPIGEFLLF